jgi:phosphoglycolate phosphatase
VSNLAYHLVIFDFDGTLADTFGWFVAAVNRLAADEGIRRIEPDELEVLRGLDARRVIAHLGVPVWKLPRLARLLRAEMTREITGIRLFPGVTELLSELTAAGVELAVVTSNSAMNVRRVLGPGNANLIRYWECGAELFGKRLKLRRVLQRSRTLPGAAMAIGDEIRDFEAARVEKIPFGAVTWGFTRPESLAALAPEALFRTVQEIGETIAPRQRLR